MDGIIATKEVCRLYPKVTVIGMSYYSNEILIIIDMLDAGAQGFISKNVKIDHLKNLIKNIMNKEQYFSPDIDLSILRMQQLHG